MDSKPTITLPDRLIERCWKQAGVTVADYVNAPNASIERSRSVSYRGAETNPRLQALAKMAECAVCLWAGLDPTVSLNWLRVADRGYDLRWMRTNIDVKHSELNSPRFLLWPIKKNHLFERKPFDAMILVGGTSPHFHLIGWTTKTKFGVSHNVAGEKHSLDAGTWFMLADDLWPVESLKAGIELGFAP